MLIISLLFQLDVHRVPGCINTVEHQRELTFMPGIEKSSVMRESQIAINARAQGEDAKAILIISKTKFLQISRLH